MSELHKSERILQEFESLVRSAIDTKEVSTPTTGIDEDSTHSFSVGIINDEPTGQDNHFVTSDLTIGVLLFYEGDTPRQDLAIDREKIERSVFSDCQLCGLAIGIDAGGLTPVGEDTEPETNVTAYQLNFVIQYQYRKQ